MRLNRWMRRVCAPVIFALASVFALAACGGGSASNGSAPVSAPAGGSPAPAPKVASVTLSWEAPKFNSDGSPLKDLAGFHIRYGLNPNALDQSVSTGPAITTAMIEGLSSGVWYFEVVAFNSVGIESDSSGIASSTING